MIWSGLKNTIYSSSWGLRIFFFVLHSWQDKKYLTPHMDKSLLWSHIVIIILKVKKEGMYKTRQQLTWLSRVWSQCKKCAKRKMCLGSLVKKPNKIKLLRRWLVKGRCLTTKALRPREKKGRKAAAEEHRKSPMKCLQQTRKRKIEDMLPFCITLCPFKSIFCCLLACIWGKHYHLWNQNGFVKLPPFVAVSL